MSRRELAGAALGSAVVTLIFVAVAARHGALGVSRNDDWTYYRVAFDMAENQRFAPDPYTQSMLLGQALMAQPVIGIFGAEFAPLQVLVALLGSAGLLATYVVIRSFLRPVDALISVGVLVLGPIYGTTSVSFMTDVPAFAFQAFALWAAVRALASERLDYRWLAIGFGLCLVAFSIREYSAAAALAITLTLLWTRRKSQHVGRLLGLPIVWLLAAAALYPVRRSLAAAGTREPIETILSVATLQEGARTLATLALLAFPVAVPILGALLGGRTRTRLWTAAGVLVTTAVAALAVQAFGNARPLGNYLTAFGSYPETIAGPQTRLWPEPLWYALAVTMLVTLALLVWLAVRVGWQTDGVGTSEHGHVGAALSTSFAISVPLVVVGVTAVATANPFDRYVMPGIPFVVASALYGARRLYPGRSGSAPWRLGTLVALACFAVIGLRTVDASATLDGAKWRLGEAVAAQDVDPATVDAGLEWFGMHQAEPIVMQSIVDPRFGFWVSLLFENPRVCVAGTYAAGVPADADVVARVSADSWTGAHYDLVAYRADLDCELR